MSTGEQFDHPSDVAEYRPSNQDSSGLQLPRHHVRNSGLDDEFGPTPYHQISALVITLFDFAQPTVVLQIRLARLIPPSRRPRSKLAPSASSFREDRTTTEPSIRTIAKYPISVYTAHHRSPRNARMWVDARASMFLSRRSGGPRGSAPQTHTTGPSEDCMLRDPAYSGLS